MNSADKQRAREELSLAALRLHAAANAYQMAWELQRAALESMGRAFESITRAFGQVLPEHVAAALAGYNAAAAEATLVMLMRLDDEQLLVLEKEASELKTLAGAARRVAEALGKAGGDA